VLLEAFDAIPARSLRHAGGAYFGVKGREALRTVDDGAEAFVAAPRAPLTVITARPPSAGLASGDFAAAE
jgi:hypothetical protein